MLGSETNSFGTGFPSHNFCSRHEIGVINIHENVGQGKQVHVMQKSTNI